MTKIARFLDSWLSRFDPSAIKNVINFRSSLKTLTYDELNDVDANCLRQFRCRSHAWQTVMMRQALDRWTIRLQREKDDRVRDGNVRYANAVIRAVDEVVNALELGYVTSTSRKRLIQALGIDDVE